MYKILLFIVISSNILLCDIFKIASYNVQNLFDLNYNKTEYQEYIPNKKSLWNNITYTTKLFNIIKVINDLNSSIIALQEIESKNVLEDISKYTKYKYKSFIKHKNSAIGLAILSKYKILKSKTIYIKNNSKLQRPIQKIIVKIKNHNLIIFNNHWPSKKNKESKRVKYALILMKYIKQYIKDSEYLIIGDLNSNYNEYETFKYNKKLNDTSGITSINHILNTTINNKYITKYNIYDSKFNSMIIHYNLWLELKYKNRFSYKYKGTNTTPDNILLSKKLLDNKNIEYINNSFNVFKPVYLYKNNQIKKWKIKKNIHQNSGYSDHLPIYALFKINNNITKIKKSKKMSLYSKNNIKISQLYNIDTLEQNIILKNIIVIYKYKNNYIIKQKNDKPIYIYNTKYKLQLGYMYNIQISSIKNYYGLKQISKIEKIKSLNKKYDYKKLYKNSNTINIKSNKDKYNNEIITSLKGIYKNNYLHYKYKNIEYKIKLYSKNKKLLPKNNQKINIISGHLIIYKSKLQIKLHKKSDYELINN